MTKLVKVSRTKNGALQAEFAAQILKPNSNNNALALLNLGDDRFKQASERRAWMTVSALAMQTYFGIDVSNLQNEQSIEINLDNPKVNGNPLNVQIQEFTQKEIQDRIAKTTSNGVKSSLQYLLDNALKTAKQVKTEEGTKYFIKDGGFIFSISTVVVGEAQHKFITDATMVAESTLVNESATAQAASVNLVG